MCTAGAGLPVSCLTAYFSSKLLPGFWLRPELVIARKRNVRGEKTFHLAKARICDVATMSEISCSQRLQAKKVLAAEGSQNVRQIRNATKIGV